MATRAWPVFLVLATAVAGQSGAPFKPSKATKPAAAAAPLMSPPRWRVGDTWTLKVRYRSLDLGAKARAKKHGRQPKPRIGRLRKLMDNKDPLVTYWTYKVTSSEQLDAQSRVWIVQAKDKDGHKDALSSLLFRELRTPVDPDDPGATPFSERGLSEAKFMAPQAGEPVLRRVIFWRPPDSPRPVMSQESPIPHTFPMLPLTGPSEIVFEETRQAGEMAFSFDISQIVSTGVRAADLAGGADLKKRLQDAELPTEGLTLVELSRDFDGAFVRQLWAPGYPWPIYGEDASSSFHLVYHFLRKDP